MKNVKMLGLGNKLETIIEGMRRKELDISKRFRRLSSFNIFLSMSPTNQMRNRDANHARQ